ncbi:MAG TPA: succinate dehydrogenase iron-sulfur subunit, partial [Idiomarina loihiensis]|nr:succinate dehydrogenase iron-sulfur subunit [Idiomarina loihiensis]
MKKYTFSVYRYNPDVDNAPHMKEYTLEVEDNQDLMVLEALIKLKEQDPSLA